MSGEYIEVVFTGATVSTLKGIAAAIDGGNGLGTAKIGSDCISRNKRIKLAAAAWMAGPGTAVSGGDLMNSLSDREIRHDLPCGACAGLAV